MEEKEQKLTLHDISQALSSATRKEMAEFVTALQPLLLEPLYDVAVWSSRSFEQKEERIAKTPWVWDMLSRWEKMAYAREKRQRMELYQCIAEIHGLKHEKRSGGQKTPWWKFWE